MFRFSTGCIVLFLLHFGNAQRGGGGQGASGDPCPPGLPKNKYLQVRNGVCYEFVFYQTRLWQQSQDECEKHGGSLVVIDSQDMNDFIISMLNHIGGQSHLKREANYNYFWIGLDDYKEEGKFHWVDGTSPTYTNWAQGHGKAIAGWGQKTMDCAVIDKTKGTWVDIECMYYPIHYICQYKH